MGLTSEDVLGWTRVGVLLLVMGWAAWMDNKERRVPNEHWMVWVKPALFIWALDLMAQNADWSIYLTASAVVAYASTAIIGRPTFSDVLAGSKIDIIVSLWYLISLGGIIGGAMKYGDVSPIDVLIGNSTGNTSLWWSTLSVLLTILIIDLAWRFRLIHGGADAKALMLVAILIPNWNTMPLISDNTLDSVVALPPALALLMWGGLTFLLIPVVLFIKNLYHSNISSISDLRLSWHASKMKLEKVFDSHVWLLTSVMDLPDGSSKVYHKSRAPRRTPSDEQLQLAIKKLEEHDVDEVWISYKLPLLVFLFPVIIPMALFGDPISFIMPMIGL
ncbi:MAG: hypothetical protein CBE08_000845 [Euryarchaeota archaeon TMED248]|nr:MAG: hypothetical protein CBE08_000845 [Euryarchaeota archaeon TMED248]|tara:strand:+ start:4776 stop:5771 length:996 start_codon:yes stop_codon:yes gene_type:complete